MDKLTSTWIFSILLLSLIHLPSVIADGVPLSEEELHLGIPSQKAVIHWDGQAELMVISSKITSDDISNMAWVLPIESTSKPSVTASTFTLFEALVDYFKVHMDPQQYGEYLMNRDAGGVEVVESKSIGIYNITILKADTSADLLSWLNENGYVFPDAGLPVLEKYTNKGNMYFVANRIDLKNIYSGDIAALEQFINASIAYERRDLAENLSAFNLSPLGDTNFYNYKLGIRRYIVNHLQPEFDRISTFNGENYMLNSSTSGFNQYLLEHMRDGAVFYMDIDDNYFVKVYFYPEMYPYASIIDKEMQIDAVLYYKEHVYFKEPDIYSKDYVSDSIRRVRLMPIAWFSDTLEQGNSNLELVDSQSFYFGLPHYEEKYKIMLNSSDSRNRLLHDAVLERMSIADSYMGVADDVNAVLKKYDKLEHLIGLQTLREKLDAADSLKGHESIAASMENLSAVLRSLREGTATPLEISFRPTQPYYPLAISSVISGRSVIEVYFLSASNLMDLNNMLVKEMSLDVDSGLRQNLSAYINISPETRYASRFSWRGNLRNLSHDAIFGFPGTPVTELPSKQDYGQSGLSSTEQTTTDLFLTLIPILALLLAFALLYLKKVRNR